MQLVGQSAEEPSQTYGWQVGAPGSPAATSEQVPSEPARSQRTQAPAQALLQQMLPVALGTHDPLAHSPVALQLSPSVSLAVHSPLPQKKPVAQPASPAQPVGQI